jgi:hypothetical protein
MRSLLARYSALKESRRLRIVGTLVLVLGVLVPGAFYLAKVRPNGPVMDQLMPGYDRARARQVGILMGHTGVMMLEWQDALALPGTQALMMAVVFALVAAYFFRAAWVLDDDERCAAEDERQALGP